MYINHLIYECSNQIEFKNVLVDFYMSHNFIISSHSSGACRKIVLSSSCIAWLVLVSFIMSQMLAFIEEKEANQVKLHVTISKHEFCTKRQDISFSHSANNSLVTLQNGNKSPIFHFPWFKQNLMTDTLDNASSYLCKLSSETELYCDIINVLIHLSFAT